jgi:NADPH-dependent curcumin reductase CurA
MKNRAFVFAERPQGMPDESTFRMVELPIPELKEGETLLRAPLTPTCADASARHGVMRRE